MRGRTAIARTAHRLRLTAVGWGLVTVLTCVALAACTSSGTGGLPTPTSSLTGYRPTASATPTPTSTATSTASSSTSPSASPTPSQTPTPSPSPSPAYTSYPPAPVTGGGGTAGFQDVGLAVLGAAAILAGLASIAYRRRLTRHR